MSGPEFLRLRSEGVLKILNERMTNLINQSINDDKGVFVDVKGIFKDRIKNIEYWSL